jgi:alpha-amylase
MRKMTVFMLALFMLGTLVSVPIIAQDDAPPDGEWWQETVWYLMFVRSFYDSDGDGIGDLQGVIEKLDYLNDGDPTTDDDLGITGIWLLPIFAADSYHGYDTIDYRRIDPDYGTMEDFQALVDAAHERGIRIVLDLVVNHTADEHPWFEAAAAGDEDFRDWYIFADENPNYRGPWGDVAWHRSGDDYYYGVFWSGMPDLNYENPAVVAEMQDIARFWLEETGIDGYRLDAVRYLIETEVDGRPITADAPVNRDFLRDFSDYVHRVAPDAMTVGEVLASTAVVSRYADDDVTDMLFEFTTAERIINAAALGNKREIERQLAMNLRTYETDEIALLTTNHDIDRLLTQLGDDNLLANRVAANLLMTLPGSPFIYYGEEIGMLGGKPDELIRRPFHWDDTPETGGFTIGTPWQALQDDFQARTVAGMTDDPDSLLSHYRGLIHMRNAQPALQYGATIALESDYRAAWGYLRYTADETRLIVMNLDDRETRPYTLSMDASPFASFSSAELVYGTTDAEIAVPELNGAGGFSDYMPFDAPLPPGSLYVIRLQ